MVGLLQRFWGQRSDESVDSATLMAVSQQKNTHDFYLSPDEAKTLDDLEFMRTPRKIHHTFHKASSSKDGQLEFFDEVSSMGHFHSSRKH